MAKKQITKHKASPPVASIHHKDKRKNIPTEELRDFVAQDEQTPKTMLYPRDYWYRMKRREKATSGVELSTFCRQLKPTATWAHKSRDAAQAIRSYLVFRRTITV